MFKKSIFCTLALIVSTSLAAFGETRNIVPRADGEGGIGTAAKRWGNLHSKTSTVEKIILHGSDLDTLLFGGTTTDATARASISSLASTQAIHTAQLATQDTFRVGSRVNYATNAGDSVTVGGLTAEELMRVGVQYYFSTNVITYGAVTGRTVTLTVPTDTQSATYAGPVTNGQYIATYLFKSNEMPSVLLRGTYSFVFNGYHDGNGKHPMIGGDLYVVTASNGVVVQEFENTVGTEVMYSADQIAKPFTILISITNDIPKDGYAFVLKTKMIHNDGYNGALYSFFGKGYWSGFITPIVGSQFPTRDEVTGMISASGSNNTLQAVMSYGSTATNTGMAIGSADLTQGKVYVRGEGGTYTNKPLLVLDRSASGTGKLQSWRTNGVEVSAIDVSGRITGDGSLLTGVSTLGSNTFTGVQKLSGNAIAWDDMLGSAATAYKSGVTDISDDDALGGRSYATTSTTNANNDHLTFTFQAPHRRKLGSNMHPHVHFYQTNADQTNCWYMYYAIVPLGSNNVADTFLGPATNEFAYTGGTMHQYAEFPSIDGPQVNISSVIRIKLHRRGASGTGAITMTDFDLHYMVDGFGSDAELNKSY